MQPETATHVRGREHDEKVKGHPAGGFNPFEMAQAQFDKVANLLELDRATRDLHDSGPNG
jgi:hypothetical protein